MHKQILKGESHPKLHSKRYFRTFFFFHCNIYFHATLLQFLLPLVSSVWLLSVNSDCSADMLCLLHASCEMKLQMCVWSSEGPDRPRCVSCGGFVRCSGRRIQHFGQHLGFAFSHSENPPAQHLRPLFNSCSRLAKGVQKLYSEAGMKPHIFHLWKLIMNSHLKLLHVFIFHTLESILIFNHYVKILNHVFLKTSNI